MAVHGVNDTPRAEPGPPAELSDFEVRLVNAYQRGFPLAPRPYAEMARTLGASEDTVLATVEDLRRRGILDRVGAVFAPHRAGWSTLAAMAVPPHRLDEVAAIVSRHEHVNHNYEREHVFNLWFVVAAADEAEVRAVLDDIAEETGLSVMDLPLEAPYHIDLGFKLS